MPPRPKTSHVLVYLDDQPLHVPKTVESHWAVRGVLGVRRGEGVARATDPTRPLTFSRGHTFEERERYVTLDGEGLFVNFPNMSSAEKAPLSSRQ